MLATLTQPSLHATRTLNADTMDMHLGHPAAEPATRTGEQQQPLGGAALQSHLPQHQQKWAPKVAAATTNNTRKACIGDIVTLDLDLHPENGFVPERLFDTTGRISFILGWGNYLPGLHSLAEGRQVGDEQPAVSIDAGFGSSNPGLIFRVPKSNFPSSSVDTLRKGATVHLKNGKFQVLIRDIVGDTVIVDANHPLAGSSYACSFKVLDVQPIPTHAYEQNHEGSRYQVATWAMGCFWGGELAFMRQKGVVGTKVGYTQGVTTDPTYEEVCRGTTQHREAVMVVYDTTLVSYEDLLAVYMVRLAATTSQYKIPLMPEEDSHDPAAQKWRQQYKHGVYFHNDKQRELAQVVIDDNDNFYQVELLMASKFYDAEDYHQQYLLKGGQSARKGDKETIRCFG